jgi:hypothetical protein
MKKFGFKPLSFATEKIVGVFAALRIFFSKLGAAKRSAVDREIQQIEDQKSLGFPISPTRIAQIEKDKKDVYGVKELVESLPPGMDQEYYFNALVDTLQALGRTESTIEEKKIYVFKYIAESKGWYDVFPVSVIVNKTRTGVRGYNYHWEKYMNYIQNPYRNYNYSRFDSQFYRVEQHELEYVLKINTFLPIFNR